LANTFHMMTTCITPFPRKWTTTNHEPTCPSPQLHEMRKNIYENEKVLPDMERRG